MCTRLCCFFQSSWTKQGMEVDSHQVMSPGDQKDECLDSTCAQFIRSNAEISCNGKVLTNVAGEGAEKKQPGILSVLVFGFVLSFL